MIKEARKKLDINTELTVGDAEKLPYKDSQFDVVICINKKGATNKNSAPFTLFAFLFPSI